MESKTELRRRILRARDGAADRAEWDQRIARRLSLLPAFVEAGTVCWYVGIRSEVATVALLAQALTAGRRCLVPACRGTELELIQLGDPGELVPARFGLLEPSPAICALPGRIRPALEVDCFIVPGVAFDSRGHRLGYGRGYYDRLLASARPDAWRLGLAYELQVVDRVPDDPHDLPMDLVVTERRVLGPGRPDSR